MTGTIVELTSGRRTGIIRAEDGSRLLFSAAAVLGEFETLAVGHRVTFDLDRSMPVGSAVHILRQPPPSILARKAGARLDVRYIGFDQAQGVRKYKFAAVADGQSARRFIVTVDVALLLKHHVAVQELPALCLRKLVADLEASPESRPHELGNDDLLAFALSRAAAAQRKRSKPGFDRHRHSPPPSPWSRPPGTG